MDRELEMGGDKGYLMPWLLPAIIVAGFIAVVIIVWFGR